MTNATNISDLAKAANAAYGGASAPVMSARWTEVNMAQFLQGKDPLNQAISDNAYAAKVYVDRQTGEVIIANRGTVPSQTANLYTDVPGSAQTCCDSSLSYRGFVVGNVVKSGIIKIAPSDCLRRKSFPHLIQLNCEMLKKKHSKNPFLTGSIKRGLKTGRMIGETAVNR